MYILDALPERAAKYYCDRDIETSIILCLRSIKFSYESEKCILPGSKREKFYRSPIAKWVRYSRENFNWTLFFVKALIEEYHYRFDKNHPYKKYINWVEANMPTSDLRSYELTEWPVDFGDWSDILEESGNAIEDFRKLYTLARRNERWTRRNYPEWFR